MTDQEHTPLPWNKKMDQYSIYGADGSIITDCRMYRRGEANTDLIIAGANGMPGLLEENRKLREALALIEEWPFDIMGDCVADAQGVARKALAQAEGEPK